MKKLNHVFVGDERIVITAWKSPRYELVIDVFVDHTP